MPKFVFRRFSSFQFFSCAEPSSSPLSFPPFLKLRAQRLNLHAHFRHHFTPDWTSRVHCLCKSDERLLSYTYKVTVQPDQKARKISKVSHLHKTQPCWVVSISLLSGRCCRYRQTVCDLGDSFSLGYVFKVNACTLLLRYQCNKIICCVRRPHSVEIKAARSSLSMISAQRLENFRARFGLI